VGKKEWLVLNFMLPKEQSSVRVSVWRKLKKCGAVGIGQSLWVLPASERHAEIFSGISGEITANGGSAYLANADFLDTGKNGDVVSLFGRARDEEYREFLEKCGDFFREIEKETAKENFSFAELEENEDEYEKLSGWLKKIGDRDFFGAPLKEEAEKALQTCRSLLAAFSSETYGRAEAEDDVQQR
jgi:hypothetical protein